jgi:hypothetical protein
MTGSACQHAECSLAAPVAHNGTQNQIVAFLCKRIRLAWLGIIDPKAERFLHTK